MSLRHRIAKLESRLSSAPHPDEVLDGGRDAVLRWSRAFADADPRHAAAFDAISELIARGQGREHRPGGGEYDAKSVVMLVYAAALARDRAATARDNYWDRWLVPGWEEAGANFHALAKTHQVTSRTLCPEENLRWRVLADEACWPEEVRGRWARVKERMVAADPVLRAQYAARAV